MNFLLANCGRVHVAGPGIRLSYPCLNGQLMPRPRSTEFAGIHIERKKERRTGDSHSHAYYSVVEFLLQPDKYKLNRINYAIKLTDSLAYHQLAEAKLTENI